MSTSINHHVFHSLFSNGYNDRSISKYNLIYQNPIHVKRAIMGGQDPFLQQEEREDPINKPIEFENEKEAFLWYKKTRNLERQYNELITSSEEKEDIFCKNYFIIPEEEFYKYKGYFNGMIKSLVTDLNCNINYQGSYSAINDCPCDSSSSSSSSSIVEPSSANINLSPSVLLNILELSDIEFIENIGNEIISLQENSSNSNTLCCQCPPCDIESSYKCSTNYNINLNLYINFDSSKIFEIETLEKRLDAISIDREFSPYYGDYREDITNVEEDPEDPYGDTYVGPIDELAFFGDFTDFSNIKIFMKDWLLNNNNNDPEKNWDFFFKKIENNKKFSNNSTIINDPVIYNKNNPRWRIEVRPEMLGRKSDGGPYGIKERISLQSEEKKSNNLGNYILKIFGGEESITTNIVFILDIDLTDILYIKSEKKYMCFIELGLRTEDTVNFYIETTDNEYRNVLDGRNIPNFLTLYSTDDSLKLFDKDHILCPNLNRRGIKLVKTKIPIYIGDNLIELEAYTPEEKIITYTQNRSTISTNICPDNDRSLETCSNLSITKSNSLLDTPPFIKINLWSDDDFNKSNTFPTKRS